MIMILNIPVLKRSSKSVYIFFDFNHLISNTFFTTIEITKEIMDGKVTEEESGDIGDNPHLFDVRFFGSIRIIASRNFGSNNRTGDSDHGEIKGKILCYLGLAVCEVTHPHILHLSLSRLFIVTYIVSFFL